jgi:hypothetical protein
MPLFGVKSKTKSNPSSVSLAPPPKTVKQDAPVSTGSSQKATGSEAPKDSFKMVSSQQNTFAKAPTSAKPRPMTVVGAELSYGKTDTKLGNVGTAKMEQALPGSQFDPNRKSQENTNINGKSYDLTNYQAKPTAQQRYDQNFKVTQGTLKQTQIESTVKDAQGKIPSNVTEPEAKAIANYTSDLHGPRGERDFRVMNETLYKNDSKSLQARTEMKDDIKTTASGLNKMPAHQGTVYRSADMPKNVQDNYKVGTTVSEPGFTSTSQNQKTAHNNKHFDGNTKYTIESRTGRDISSVSTHKGEQEVLFPPGTNFDVTKTKEVVRQKRLLGFKLPPVNGQLQGETFKQVHMSQVPSQN